jgi:hypothetical protein
MAGPMLGSPHTRLVALALACVAGVGASAERLAETPGGEGPRLGFLLDPARAVELPRVAEGAAGAAPIVRVEARWDLIERVPGAYDWTAIAPAVEALDRAGYRTALALTGSHPHYLPGGGLPSPLVGRSLEAWLEFVRSAARTLAGRVEVFELGETRPGASDDDADVRALVLKQSALAVRAEAGSRGAVARVAQAALPVGSLDWQRSLWRRDLAAYIDVLPLVVEATDDLAAPASAIREVFEEALKHPPAPALWVYVSGGSGWEPPALAVAALTFGASAALFAPEFADPGTEQTRWATGLQRTFAEGYQPAAAGRLRLEYEGVAPSGARILGRFFNERDFTTLVVYHAPASPPESATAELIVDAKVVRNVRQLDPVNGTTRRVRNRPADDGTGRALRVATAPEPRAALFQRQVATPGFELAPEDVEVETERGLTAEEIIARFQLLQQDQDDRLERWMAAGRIDFHFKLAQGSSTVDVSIDSNYFWERGGQLEWEQTSYYVNGNKVRWKNIPELPLIQPEKVITLPLDLTLDKTYAYRLVGEDRVDGREVYVLAFEPATPDPERSLYRGRLWIDKETFSRLKAAVIQTNLGPPVLSNEEIDRFAPRVGPDGRPYWMFASIDGQQVWNAAGRTFVVRRELTFREFEINPPRDEFEQHRRRAYASNNQMLRETDQGFRYLEREADGTRTVKLTDDTSQLFAAGGMFKDSSQDNVVPLAGVNYFNYDLWGKNIQFNALFAGVLGFVTASKPTLGGTRMDLTADAALSALKLSDKVFDGDDEIDAERIETRGQGLALRLGLPAGQFFKFHLIGGLAYRQYFDSSTGDNAIAALNAMPPPGATTPLEFVLPEDHLQVTGTAEVELNRRGYNLTGAYSHATRSDWEPWGLRDAEDFGRLVDGTFEQTGGEPVEDAFTRWRVSAGKEWYLPKFQKIRGAVDYLGGSDLDRFSRYQFSFFGDDRLNGFSGTGVRFDEGLIGRVGYAFNLFEVIRLDAVLESARVEQDGSGRDTEAFTGAGLSGNFIGPWKTVINVNYGYAISSDIPDLEGEQEFLLLVLKLF